MQMYAVVKMEVIYVNGGLWEVSLLLYKLLSTCFCLFIYTRGEIKSYYMWYNVNLVKNYTLFACISVLNLFNFCKAWVFGVFPKLQIRLSQWQKINITAVGNSSPWEDHVQLTASAHQSEL